jgi:hypothetical protein
MATYKKNIWHTGEIITAEKMNNIENQLTLITPAATNIIPTYEPTEVYSSGDYCEYKGKFYKLTSETSSKPPIYDDNWEETNIGYELQTMGAYEMACKHGYTGTYEQFVTDLGYSAENATAAASAADAAISAAASVTPTDENDLKWILGEV